MSKLDSDLRHRIHDDYERFLEAYDAVDADPHAAARMRLSGATDTLMRSLARVILELANEAGAPRRS